MANPPEFNADALAEQLRGVVREEVATAQQTAKAEAEAAQRQQAQQTAQRQQAQAASQQWQDPVGQTLAPYVLPIAQQAAFQTRAAEDKVDFYLDHEEARPYRAEIEDLFHRSVAARNPQTRESLWYYFKGRNADRLAADDRTRAEAVARQTVQTGAVLGPSLRMAEQPISMADFAKLPVEDMEKVLAGHTF